MTLSKTIAILGATGGLGSAVARRLAAGGDRVILGGRKEAALRELATDLGAEYRVVDAANFSQTDEFMSFAAGSGVLDGVVNCAGSLLLKPAHLTSAEEYEHALSANLTTAFSTVRAAARVLRKNGGSIVLVSSAAADVGLQNHEAIAAAKAGAGFG